MAPGSRAARRRENGILLHILIISCMLVVGFWILFGVIPLPGVVTRGHWQQVYWHSQKEEQKIEALRHLRGQKDAETFRIYVDALGRNDERLSTETWDWFDARQLRELERRR